MALTRIITMITTTATTIVKYMEIYFLVVQRSNYITS